MVENGPGTPLDPAISVPSGESGNGGSYHHNGGMVSDQIIGPPVVAVPGVPEAHVAVLVQFVVLRSL